MEEILKLLQEIVKEDTITDSKKDTDKTDKETDVIDKLLTEMFSKATEHNCSECKIKATCVSPESGNTTDFALFGSAVMTVLIKNVCTKEPKYIVALTEDFVGILQKMTSAISKCIAGIESIKTEEQKKETFNIIINSMALLFRAAWVLKRLMK